MSLEIRKLTPEMAEDYARFFDTTPHATGQAEHRCYCVWWSSGDMEQESFDSVEKRRALAVRWIESGYIQGYLAYENNRVVGWCNANTKSDCYGSFCWKRFMGAVHRDAAGIKVKSVYCFAIAPEMRGKGVAARLLERVCEDAKRDGFDFVEGYPNKSFISMELDFMGPVGLYEKQGFRPLYEVDGSERKIVMRKGLTS